MTDYRSNIRVIGKQQSAIEELEGNDDNVIYELSSAIPSTSFGSTPGIHLKTGAPTNYTGMTPSRPPEVGIGIISAFCENVLSHPFIVFRRQCQVNKTARKYHLTPFTVIPVMIHLQSRQGLGTLWKGIGSVFFIRGLTLVCEDAISKATQWQKELHGRITLGKLCQHMLLKTITFVAVCPFYSACLVELVQSDIASEKPGILDCAKEGLYRILNYNATQTSRLLPIWFLSVPMVAYGVSHYTISSLVYHITIAVLRKGVQSDQNPNSTEDYNNSSFQLSATFVSHLLADCILYPMETVLNRLHLQGTRTIIDNLDTGLEVTPIITKYDGAMDCFHCVVEEEGASGLFKGIGALILQYMIYASVLKLTKFILQGITENKFGKHFKK